MLRGHFQNQYERSIRSKNAYRLLHSVVNNSRGFNPQWKVVALIFSAARLPRLLKEIRWQFAAGLPAFSLLPFFRTQTTTCLQSWLHSRTPGRASKKVPVLLFKTVSQLGKSLGPKFGVQIRNLIWSPNLGPPSHAFLVAGLRATCNSPNSYALPRRGRTGCGRDTCLIDQ